MTGPQRIALLGNPNTGKTTLFNRLTGLRQKTSNFPGTTLEARSGRLRAEGKEAQAAHVIDLPGIYSLELDQIEAAVCRAVLAGEQAPIGEAAGAPDVILVVADAANLSRNLVLAGEALRRRLPMVVAVNMIDLARRRGLHIDAAKLSERLGCEVVCLSARTGEGQNELVRALQAPRIPTRTPPGDDAALRAWAEEAHAASAAADPSRGEDSLSDRLDRVFTHPVLGVGLFALVMAGLFYVLFSLATVPMDLIEATFSWVGGGLSRVLPEGILSELLTDGILGGISGTVVFLPQICLLFFLISLLEDTGYLARAAFVMDRVLRPFGLPGHSFVPLLSSHACALPGIMACRAIPDRRERLATILAAPFMTCSARLPVYVLLVSVLFPGRAGVQSLAFVGCYALGMVAGVLSALLARRTILRGASRALAMELPSYKIPSLRTALLTTIDRAVVFLRKAGTVILAIVILLWWCSEFPKSSQSGELRDRAAAVAAASPDEAATLELRANQLDAESSIAGRLGRGVQPLFAPLGFDWRLTIGVMTSFAAREVFVSTMAVMTTGQEDGEEQEVLDRLAQSTRDDGVTPVFTRPVCWALLVYYVLAMQCLPTLAVTAREAGGVRWAMLQLVWMCGVAYLAAWAAFAATS